MERQVEFIQREGGILELKNKYGKRDGARSIWFEERD
jgi:hypothetical protein